VIKLFIYDMIQCDMHIFNL